MFVDLKKTSSTKLDEFYKDDRDGLFYISHASVLVKLSGKYFLFDPVLAKPPHFGSWLFFPEMVLDKRLLEVDGVFVSHQHLDHCDTDFLKQLPKTTPIYILEGRPQFTKIFAEAGLNFHELEADKIIEIQPSIHFVGIEHEYNKIDSALSISNGSFTVYHGNDCFVSSQKLDIVKKWLPKIDVACVPFAYVHWYPFLLDDVEQTWKQSEADRLINMYLEYGLKQVEVLKPDLAIPFGANMFYFDGVDSDHNKAVLTPFDFKQYAQEKCFPLESAIKPLFAGDLVFKNQNGSLEIKMQGMSLKELHEALSKFIEKVKINGNGWDLKYLFEIPTDQLKDVSFIEKRIKSAKTDVNNHIIYLSNVDEKEENQFVKIDLTTGKSSFCTEIDKKVPFHHFKLTDLAFRAYISQEFSFNEIVASSQFRLSRYPNEYNLPVLNVINNIL